MPRSFRPSCDPLEGRDLPASGLVSAAWGLYALYTSAPIAVARKIAFGGKIGRLAWTGQARFAFGLVQVTHPYPLRRRALRADPPKLALRLVMRSVRRPGQTSGDALTNAAVGPGHPSGPPWPRPTKAPAP